MIMKRLAMLRKDSRERDAPAFRKRDRLHPAHDFLLDAAEDDIVPRHGVHLVTECGSIIQLLDFAILLHQSHRNYRLCQCKRELACHLSIVALEERSDLHGIVIPRRRHEMDRPACCQCLGNHIVQNSIRRTFFNTCKSGFGSDTRLRTHPDDVPDFHIVRENLLITIVQVNDSREQRFIYAEEIQPGAVLTEFVTVVFILCGGLCIAYEQRNTSLAFSCAFCHLGHQRLTSSYINTLVKHCNFLLFNR